MTLGKGVQHGRWGETNRYVHTHTHMGAHTGITLFAGKSCLATYKWVVVTTQNTPARHWKPHHYRGFNSGQPEGCKWGISKGAGSCIDMQLTQPMQWWNAPLCSHGLGTGYSHAAPGSWGTIFPCRWETISIFSTCCSVGIRNASAYTTEIMCETESYCSLFFFFYLCKPKIRYGKCTEEVNKCPCV